MGAALTVLVQGLVGPPGDADPGAEVEAVFVDLPQRRQLTDLGAGRQSAHSPNQKQQQCGNSRELPLQSLNPQSLGSRARDAEVIEVGVAAGGFGGEVKESKPIPHKVGEGVHHLQRAAPGDPLLSVGAVGEIG